MSTTRSSFNQHYISHKTISHRAAAAAGSKVHRECPSSQQFLATPLDWRPCPGIARDLSRYVTSHPRHLNLAISAMRSLPAKGRWRFAAGE